MLYKNGERIRDFFGLFIFIVVQFSIFWGRFPTRSCWITDDYSQLGATRLVGYLSSHIQRALTE